MKNRTASAKLIILLLIFFISFDVAAQVQIRRAMTLMGSRFEVTLVDKDTTTANTHIDQVVSEIDRIENLISEWRPETQLSEVNRQAGIRPVKVDKELFELTERALFFSRISDGAFDISIAAMDKLWRFDGSMDSLPSPDAVHKSVAKVGYQHIILDQEHSTIFLTLAGMKIGFGSIGKGYAADKGRELMQKMGVQGGIVNASGDLSTWGKQNNKKPWAIGLFNPFKPGTMVKVIKDKDIAMATSGNYEKYVDLEGKRYSHIIDPKTGYPATGLVSVTIYGPSAEFANGLSTSIMVLGKQAGLQLLKQYPTYKAVLITDKGQIIKK